MDGLHTIYIYRERETILHGDAKIWILSSSGENNILRMTDYGLIGLTYVLYCVIGTSVLLGLLYGTL